MNRTVFCRKYQQELPGLDHPPFPGKLGEDIYLHISAKAWQEWQHLQTMLINEKRLNMMDSAARNFLNDEREKFFSNAATAKPEGYIPPKS